MIIFNWLDARWQDYKGSKLFEELCYELVGYEGFTNLQWRGGSGDKGRDIQAEFISDQPGGMTRVEKWWFQCKRYSKHISRSDIGDAFDHADAENIDYFIIISSNNLTPQFLDLINSLNKQKHPHKYVIKDWNHKVIEGLIKNHQEKFSDISKYFEIQRDFDEILRELRDKEKKVVREISKQKKNYECKILALENSDDKLDDIFEECIKLADKFDKFMLHGQTLGILRSIEKYLHNDFDKNFKLRVKIGEMYCKRGWGETGINEFKKALELSKKQNDSEKIFLIHYKIGNAYHIEQFYSEALHYYLSAQEYFKIHNKEVNHRIMLGIAELHMDFEYTIEAKKILDNFNTSNQKYFMQATLLKMKMHNAKGSFDSAIKLYDNVNRVEAALDLSYKIFIELSYAYWQIGDVKKAIDILESKCLPVVQEIGDEEKLMVLYQNISQLKIEIEPLSSSYWDSYSKWVDILNKIKSKYFKAELHGLYSSENIIEGKLRESLIEINKSQKIFKDLGSWQNVQISYRREGNLLLQSGDLISALKDFIRIASKEKIYKTASAIITQDKIENANLLIKELSENSPLNTQQKIGYCHAIKGLENVIEDNIIKLVITRLLELTYDNYSFTSNYNVRDPSLDSLIAISDRIPDKYIETIANRIFEIVKGDEFWNTKSKAFDLFDKICTRVQKHQIGEAFNKLLYLYNQHLEFAQNNRANSLNEIKACLLTIANHFSNNLLKEKFINILNRQLSIQNIHLKHLLGEKTDLEIIEKMISQTSGMIKDRVVIEYTYDKDKKKNIEGSGWTLSFLDEGKRITVGSNPPLNYLRILSNYNIKDELKEKLIDTCLEMIDNKYNSLANRLELIYSMRFLPIPINRYSKIFKSLFRVVDGKIEISESEAKTIEERKNPFSNINIGDIDINNLVVGAIIILSELMVKFNQTQQKKLVDKIGTLCNHKDDEIRRACATVYHNLPINNLTKFLLYYSLIGDYNEKVAARAIFSFSKFDYSKYSKDYINLLIDRIISVSISLSHSSAVNEATAYVIKSINNSNLSLSVESKDKLTRQTSNLLKHKFHSVRRVMNKL